MNQSEIENELNNIAAIFQGVDWIVGGSAALVLSGYHNEANDIDIIQHSGDRIVLQHSYEKRIWSYFYPELKYDCHFSNPHNLHGYADCFHSIIRALEYVDKKHFYMYQECKVSTPLGAGLTNWLHHFLPYGYQSAKTIFPTGNDKDMLIEILGDDKFNTIHWKAEEEQLISNHPAQGFAEFVDFFKAS